MTQFFSNLNIGARIYAGFGSVLLLVVSLAIMSGFGMHSMNLSFVEFGDIAEDALLITELDIDMGGLRIGVNRYLRSHSDADRESVAKAHERVSHGIEKAHKAIHNPERVKLLNEIEALSVAYEKGFEQVVALVGKRNVLVNDQLNVIGPNVRKNLTELNEKLTKQGDYQTANLAGIVQENFLLSRINVLKFLDLHDQVSVDSARKGFEKVELSLAQLKSASGGQNNDLLAGIEADEPKYAQTFEEVVAVIGEQDKILTGVIDANGKTISEKLNMIEEAANKDEHTLLVETKASSDASEVQNMVLAGVTLLLGGLIAWFIGKSIASPVVAMTTVMGRLADRDWTAEVAGADRKDELGQMARAVFVFKENGIAAERLQAEQRAEQEKKEARTKQIEFDIGMFEKTVASMLEMLASAATELQSTAQSMNSTADEGQRQSSTVAAASEEASANVQTVAAAGEELSSSIVEISRQVSESARISNAASEHAQKTNDQIKGLAEAASRIGEVINLIDDIASQTNLLALNATIEAARAGEAGKGFAVVASEVKNLATQTAKATGDISAKIAEMQSATNQSVNAIQIIADTISQISEINTAVASAVEEQGSATQEIARNVQEAAKGTQEVSSSISKVTQVVGETGAAASQVLSAAEELSRQSEKLQSEVDGFLQKMRAA